MWIRSLSITADAMKGLIGAYQPVLCHIGQRMKEANDVPTA